MKQTHKTDIIIIGAGAAGLMCAVEAGKRKRQVVILDHANKAGKKILMSGGGRCNFTNYNITYDNYLSDNPHFYKSALSRYTQWDFISLVDKHHIPYHEKAHGQLFCDNKSRDILQMLLHEVEFAGGTVKLNTSVNQIEHISEHHYKIHTDTIDYHCESLVIATGGLSIPTMGASPFGYKVAEQFGLQVLPTRAGLVPFTLHEHDKIKYAELSGISANSLTSVNKTNFSENILFTHRGLSGPAILQISSYWLPGETVDINLCPNYSIENILNSAKKEHPKQRVKTILADLFPKRVISVFLDEYHANLAIESLSVTQIATIAKSFENWQIKPNGTEGYRTAEVTLGGVDCNQISSKTMEVDTVPGLYFIGEVLDVTGWLGGYNFQWAWSSAWAAGQVV